jgi:hypothetical protein
MLSLESNRRAAHPSGLGVAYAGGGGWLATPVSRTMRLVRSKRMKSMRACLNSFAPAGVNCSLRGARMKSGTPNRSSKSRMLRDKGVWSMWMRSAARLKLSSSATAMK